MVYLDHNATTPLSPKAKSRLLEAVDRWGNPSSIHAVGRQATEFIEENRSIVAEALGIPKDSITFTSGGSEANTAVLLGFRALVGPEFRLLTSSVEHSSIQGAMPLIESLGGSVQQIEVDANGQIDPRQLSERMHSFRPHLVSIMAANNETGVVFPTQQIVEIARAHHAKIHVDAVQGLGKLPPPNWLLADFVTVSAHKIGGPKGVGALICKEGEKLIATHFGGSQERKRRGGTQNTLGIAGFAGAITELAGPSDWEKMTNLREKMESTLQAKFPEMTIQGKGAPRTPNTSNLRFPGIGAEVLLSALDLDGICISAGSACSSGSLNPSPTLLAMGLDRTAAKECIRVSLGKTTTPEEIDFAIEKIGFHVDRIRKRRML